MAMKKTGKSAAEAGKKTTASKMDDAVKSAAKKRTAGKPKK